MKNEKGEQTGQQNKLSAKEQNKHYNSEKISSLEYVKNCTMGEISMKTCKRIVSVTMGLFLLVSLFSVIYVNAASTYTISYNANGGSGAPSSQTKTHDKNLTLSTTKPTRSGYTFQGWSTSSTGAVKYSAGGKFTSNAKTTLYAVWTKLTYTISYNANGGSGAPAVQTKTYNTKLILSKTMPRRTGYTFLGWSTNAKAVVATYVAGESFTSNAKTTLYAVWKK